MGGNALKNTQTRRLDRAQFEAAAQAVVRGLRETFPGARVEVIPAYFSKADFGDLDVLVSADGVQQAGGGQRVSELATERFFATDQFRNGNVLSFDYRASADQTDPGFQVDVITMPDVSFDFALRYFSFNDLGNLIGRTAHKQGCSFGHDGLWYYFRDGDYKFREVLLTRDFDEALVHLGYDPKRYHQGFEDLQAIFEYVAGSKFFNRDIFLLENRNYQSRVRDRKRKTYTEFLKWCDAHPELPAYAYPTDKSEWLPALMQSFPHFKGEYDQAIKDLEEQRALKAKFNGEWVSQLTGLQGKELGGLMKRFKESFVSPEAQKAFVLQSTPEALAQRVRELLEGQAD